MLVEAYVVWWRRNIYISMLLHCSGNTIGAALALLAFFAGCERFGKGTRAPDQTRVSVRAALRCREDGPVHKEIRECIRRGEAGRRAFRVSPILVFAVLSVGLYIPWDDLRELGR